MDYTQFALAAMGPVLTAVLAAVAVAVREMTESKRRREDQTYRLERIAQQVQSVSAWLDAHGKVTDLDPETDEARAELATELRRLHASLLSELRTPPAGSRRPGSVVRDLLLIGERRGGAMVARVLFYLVTPLAVLSLSLAVASVADGRVGFGAAFVATLLLMVIYLAPVAGLWALTRALHRRAVARDQRPTIADRPKPSPVLAPYQPATPGTPTMPPQRGDGAAQLLASSDRRRPGREQ